MYHFTFGVEKIGAQIGSSCSLLSGHSAGSGKAAESLVGLAQVMMEKTKGEALLQQSNQVVAA